MSDGCKFTDNIYTYAIALYNTKITISDTDFTGSMAIYESDDSAYGSTVSRCKFSRGTPTEYYKDTFHFNGNSNIQFTECDFGDATFVGFDLGNIALQQGEAIEDETSPPETVEGETVNTEINFLEKPENLIILPEDANPAKVGSMEGNGSLSMVISLAASAISVVCLGVTLTIYKKISVKSEDNE
jgi:hypothetical protein